MLKIIYSKEGTAYSDFEVVEKAIEIVEAYNMRNINTVVVSTETILDAFRVCVVRGMISYKDVSFVINDTVVTLDKGVNYLNYPNDSLDITTHLLRELRQYRMNPLK